MNDGSPIDRPHAQKAPLVLSGLKTRPEGLSEEESASRRAQHGPNRLPESPKASVLRRFFRHFNDMLIYILIAAAGITAALGHWVDTGVILAVVLINAVIGFLQEGKAEQALAGIRRMLSLHAQVRREGEWTEAEAESLVPGDIVRLRAGDRVPADLRLLETSDLRIDEAALTGESVSSTKNTEPVEANAGVGDRSSMAFSGTMVSAGRGIGVVTATGPATEIGRINRMLTEVQELATPLTRQMRRFGVALSIIIVTMAVSLFLVGRLLHDFETADLFFAAIGFAVAAIPEGLPAILTITLALGVQRMAGRHAITRRLNAVETLGSVTVICSDKTGTLTRNEMTVRHVITDEGTFGVTGIGYEPDGHLTDKSDERCTLDAHPSLSALIRVMAVCNDAAIREDEHGHWMVIGEPTEGALRTLGRKAGFNESAYQRIAVLPFDSDRKFMATLNDCPAGERMIHMKGAPDRLLDRCTHEMTESGETRPIDRFAWETRLESLGAEGLRVLAAAHRTVSSETTELHEEMLSDSMIFLGLTGIVDPPRPEAIDAIRSCQEAGIRVKMITGDHAGTAVAIGREMGIGGDAPAVTGADLESASDDELRSLVRKHDVFARTSPEHKLRLVKALQAEGEVVAMTGDGVNDAPALRRADVGVAMGIKGTEATKEAADIVLADDNFASIGHAVEEGRTIYDNLRKSILFILPTNGAQSLVILYAVVFGLVLPITPVQILWINMVTAVTLALALAFEPAEPKVMQRPPRDPRAPILGLSMLSHIAFVSLLIGGATIAVFTIDTRQDVPIDLARTVAINVLVFGQIFYLFSCRSLQTFALTPATLLSNRFAWLTAGVLLLLQLAFIYAPFMQTWFGTAPLEARHWLIPLAIGAAVLLIVEAKKAVLAVR